MYRACSCQRKYRDTHQLNMQQQQQQQKKGGQRLSGLVGVGVAAEWKWNSAAKFNYAFALLLLLCVLCCCWCYVCCCCLNCTTLLRFARLLVAISAAFTLSQTGDGCCCCCFFWTLSLNLHTYLRRHLNTHTHTFICIYCMRFFIYILSLIGIAVFVPTFLLLFNPFLDNAWQQKQKKLTVFVSTTTKTVRGGVLARAPTLSKRAQTQRRQRRRSALLEVVCFSHLFHTHTHAHIAATRSHTHTRIQIRKRETGSVCNSILWPTWSHVSWQLPIATIFQLRLIGLRLRPQLNLLTKLRETPREIVRESIPPRRDLDLSDLLLPEQQLGALPPPPTLAPSLAIILSRPLALSLALLLSATTFYKQAVDR